MANDRFGSAVAVTGNYAIIGAFSHDSYKGAAYIFQRDSNGNWGTEVSEETYRTETQKLLASDGNAYDNFANLLL